MDKHYRFITVKSCFLHLFTILLKHNINIAHTHKHTDTKADSNIDGNDKIFLSKLIS